MAAMKSPSTHAGIELGQNEKKDLKVGLEHQITVSSPHCAVEKAFLPDMFVSFVSQKPRPNPHYEVAKLESEAWLKQIFKWTEKELEKHASANFCYLASLWQPEAELEELKTVCDWNHWIFLFDDQFDDGELSTNPENARKEVEAMTEIMRSPNSVVYSADYHPLRYIYQSVCQRIFERSSLGNQRRYIEAMEGYFSGLVGQVNVRSSAKKPDIETHLALRSDTIGVKPCLAFTEFVFALNIPDEVFEHPSMRKIQNVTAELVLLQNDTLSFHKEHSMGVNTNIIHLFREEGLSQQEAYDQANFLMHKRYRAWYVAHSEIPVWGEEVDAQVMMYLKGCLDQVLGNLYWSFNSERYFGTETAVVRKTRMVSVLF